MTSATRLLRILGDVKPERAKRAGSRKGGESSGFKRRLKKIDTRIPVGDWRKEKLHAHDRH